ncbi:pleiotropic regulatory protein for carbon source metabolism [Legionella moravica]|uniref:Translational regulator CsrA n=1 Tax=Legionella moravica TaxID=39962 RepID=A0A378JRQ7_9GAMM|nr:carbon storage regulator [Legionella moravica]KTD34677.1 pleiotropic regulatory protein for carbon source metabolism [Legionella moravica]STX61283.1 protein LvrC [Legionella moravica]
MLVLTRKAGQQIFMDKGRIQMKVIKVVDDVISIGIDAPLHIDIAREEVFSQNLAQEKLASLTRSTR